MLRSLLQRKAVGTAALSLGVSRFTASTRVHNQASSSESKSGIRLYQYKICPFCNRVKAYLDYLKIDYEAVEVNPMTKSQLAFSKDYKKVPVALVHGDVVGDSGAIIEAITKHFGPSSNSAFFPSDTDKWMEWSEKKLAVMLYPNITRTFSESWECFGYTSTVPEWSLPEQLSTRAAGAFFMALANGKIKKKYGIVDERAELKAIIKEWTNAIGDNKFLHGDTITMPDLMVYGVLRAIEGFTAFNELMVEDKPLSDWYLRVKEKL